MLVSQMAGFGGKYVGLSNSWDRLLLIMQVCWSVKRLG